MTAWSDLAAPLLEKMPTYPDASEKAADRVRQAARDDCSPVVLMELARDEEIIVRATVALNERCNPEVDTLLSSDGDERVRALLGGRIAGLLPNLGSADRNIAADHVYGILALLASDQALRVRAVIAEQIATMISAPRDLVLRLARDSAAEVSDQIIRLSPVLSDTDLLSILMAPPASTTAVSIASRSRLSGVVADAIVRHADARTILALLSNPSACIRETTLDAIVGRAPSYIDWHAPLVRRPGLSLNAVRALSEFIASDLLRILASRVDLDADKLDIVRQRLAARTVDADDRLMAKARQLKSSCLLNEDALREAAENGDVRYLLALLAVSSSVSFDTVDRILELRSAKALVSLVWRSGFSMATAVTIQRQLSQFGPDTVITATGNGDFPLSVAEMAWQIELMGEVAHAS
ncbi:MAG: DUF2336 domain-containing protein [Pseudomonadota bacterium]|nr:DUF2336 domain-containing protein [Pseudomonadota bacterium]